MWSGSDTYGAIASCYLSPDAIDYLLDNEGRFLWVNYWEELQRWGRYFQWEEKAIAPVKNFDFKASLRARDDKGGVRKTMVDRREEAAGNAKLELRLMAVLVNEGWEKAAEECEQLGLLETAKYFRRMAAEGTFAPESVLWP